MNTFSFLKVSLKQTLTVSIFVLGITLCSVNTIAQFIILSPPASPQIIEDIDIDSVGRILFASDEGILIYDTNQAWIHFDSSNGLTYSHVKAIHHKGNIFNFSEINKRLGTCNYS